MDERITIGYLTRTKGVRGWVVTEPLTDDPQRFEAVEDGTGEAHDFAQLVLRFQHGVTFHIAASAKKPVAGARDDDRAQRGIAFNSLQNVEKGLTNLGT